MKPYQLRSLGVNKYYKLATWDAVAIVWRDGKIAYPNENEARDAAKQRGKGTYRISVVSFLKGQVRQVRQDLEPFIV